MRPCATHVALLSAVLLLGGCVLPSTPADDDTGDDDAGDDDTGDDDIGDDDTGDDDIDDDDTGDDDTGDDDTSTDEGLFRAAVDGEIDPAEALERIAADGGLPVETDTGSYLFGCLCGGTGWMLAGDHEGWVGQELNQAGQLSWIEADVPAPDGSLYKFTDGEAWTSDPLGRRFGFDEFGEHSLVRASEAHLERWYGVEGFGLEPRALQVWVPDGGTFSHLLLAHDGQNLFDPEAIWGGWHLQDSLPAGILVVGIDNTGARMDEYTPVADLLHGVEMGGLGDDYADLVELVVRPLIEDHYGEAQVVGTLGSSLGGLISLHIADRYPDRYQMAISLSGTMGWGSIGADNPTMIETYPAAGHRDAWLYLDSGGWGTCWDADGDGIEDDDPDAADNYCETVQLRDALVAAGYQFDVDLWHWHEQGADHNELAWAARVWRPLEIFATR